MRKEGGKRGTILRALNHYGDAKWLRVAQKSPNNVTWTFFNTVNLLPKDLRFEHGGTNLASCPGRHLTLLRPWNSIFKIPPVVCEMNSGRIWIFQNSLTSNFVFVNSTGLSSCNPQTRLRSSSWATTTTPSIVSWTSISNISVPCLCALKFEKESFRWFVAFLMKCLEIFQSKQSFTDVRVLNRVDFEKGGVLYMTTVEARVYSGIRNKHMSKYSLSKLQKLTMRSFA